MKEILKYLAQRNGVEQDVFVLEEMSELQKELMKHRRGKENRNEIVDECVEDMGWNMWDGVPDDWEYVEEEDTWWISQGWYEVSD